MNGEQERNLEYVIAEIASRVPAKYRAGDLEHDGETLAHLPVGLLLEHAIEEAIDQAVYLLTIRRQLYGEDVGEVGNGAGHLRCAPGA